MCENSTQIVRSQQNSYESLSSEIEESPDRIMTFMPHTRSQKNMDQLKISGQPWSKAGESQYLNSFAHLTKNDVKTLSRASDHDLSQIEINTKKDKVVLRNSKIKSSYNKRDDSHLKKFTQLEQHKFKPTRLLLNRGK